MITTSVVGEEIIKEDRVVVVVVVVVVVAVYYTKLTPLTICSSESAEVVAGYKKNKLC